MKYQLPRKIEIILKSGKNNNVKLRSIVKEITKNDKSSHEFSHLQRVYFLARQIVKESGFNIDSKDLLAACLLHDLGYCIDIQDQKIVLRNMSSKGHAQRGIFFSKIVLPLLGYSKEQIEEINKAIKLHDNFKGSKEYIPTKHRLTLVIQDADNIEAIGAAGLTRWFRYAEVHDMPTYNPKIPFSKILYGKMQNFSVIHNIKSCGVNLHKDLNLKVSKQISKGKEKIIKIFIKEYLREYEKENELPQKYFGAIELTTLFRKAKNEKELLKLANSKVNESQKISKFVINYLALLKEEI